MRLVAFLFLYKLSSLLKVFISIVTHLQSQQRAYDRVCISKNFRELKLSVISVNHVIELQNDPEFRKQL